jgi:hypothetical protein
MVTSTDVGLKDRLSHSSMGVPSSFVAMTTADVAVAVGGSSVGVSVGGSGVAVKDAAVNVNSVDVRCRRRRGGRRTGIHK